MSYYRSRWYWGPETNEIMKDNTFGAETVIGGWPDHWRPHDYFPQCSCPDAEYGQLGETVDSAKGVAGASELNGTNSLSIDSAMFEPFIGGEEYELFLPENPILRWGGIGFAVLLLIAIIFGVYWMFFRRRTIQLRV